MATKKATKKTAKTAPVKSALFALGYEKCDVCGRKMKDLKAHRDDHKTKRIGEDGKRTDRSKTDALAWARRFNGREATARFEDKTAEERAKMKVKSA